MSSPGARGRFAGVVAVDGPSGVGKSTVSRLLAAELGARYLDTGAMYRAVTWVVLTAGISLIDLAAIAHLVTSIRLDVSTDPAQPGVAVDGRSVNEEVRSPAVTKAVSAVSAVPEVRQHLVQLQRQLIGTGPIVVEGRDIGSVVAPDAALKVFLTASADARAERRGTELGVTGSEGLAATATELSRRDQLDSTRATSPLQPADDAILIDTTRLGIDEVVAQLVRLATRATSEGSAPAS